MAGNRLYADAHHPFRRHTRCDHLGHRLRPGLEPCRRRHVLGRPVHEGQLDHGTAELGRRQCLQQIALAVQEAHASGTVHLVGTEHREIHVQRMEVDRNVWNRLARVQNEDASDLMGSFDNRGNIGYGTGDIAHMGHGHHLGPFRDDLVCGVGEDATVVIQIEPFEGGAGARGKFLEWQQYGMVFRAGDDDLVARFQGETLSDLATTPQ